MCKELTGLKMLVLLSFWIIAGVTAESQPTFHYRVKNSSLCLKVGKSKPFSNEEWSFNEDVIFINKNITPSYRDKADYHSSNSSLCINKLTEADSGIYTVSVMDSHYKKSTETHRLTVQEAVSTPVIKMSVIRSNLTAGFCNITVNCSIQDDWAWSVCDGDRCKTSQRSLRRVNIIIYAQSRSVVCRGNNHVSTSNVSKSIEATCFNESNAEQEMRSKTSILMIIITAVITAVCVSLCIFIVCVAKRRCSTERNNQTSPAQLIQSQPVEAQPHPAPRASTSSSLSEPEAAYENVDATQPSQTSSRRGELESQQSQPVDTVYSFLQATNVTASAGNGDCSKDAKGHGKIHEASNSHSVAPDQAEQPGRIDTVYSVLQKAKTKKT